MTNQHRARTFKLIQRLWQVATAMLLLASCSEKENGKQPSSNPQIMDHFSSGTELHFLLYSHANDTGKWPSDIESIGHALRDSIGEGLRIDGWNYFRPTETHDEDAASSPIVLEMSLSDEVLQFRRNGSFRRLRVVQKGIVNSSIQGAQK